MNQFSSPESTDNTKLHVLLAVGILPSALIALPLMLFAEFANAIIAAYRCDD